MPPPLTAGRTSSRSSPSPAWPASRGSASRRPPLQRRRTSGRFRPMRLTGAHTSGLGMLAAAAAQDPRVVALSDASDGRRTALVIGNDAYQTLPLRNAIKDAKAVAAALQKYGFAVDVATDVNFKE